MKLVKNPAQSDYKDLCQRPAKDSTDMNEIIQFVFESIYNKGDEAVKELTLKYDNVLIDDFTVKQEKLDWAFAQMEEKLIHSLEIAYNNIFKFHKAQVKESLNITISDGIELGQQTVGIQRVGIYIPGGTAPLLSTILMLAIPAKIAGCKEIVLCSPPTHNGEIHPSILATAKMCGISEVYACGGAQAIAAMSIGTKSIKKVMKVFGPGNQFVTAAKEYAMNYGVAMDLPAGPSELLVFADSTCIPAFVAADLLSQAEHGVDSQVIVVSTSEESINLINERVLDQVQKLPRRNIALQALENSRGIVIENTSKAFEFINEYAPEHLIIASENPKEYLSSVQNAGSIFLGNYCPESAGDYASGTNHTLPTGSWAKSYSGVNMDSFTKKITYQSINKTGIQTLGKTIMTMAREEQLEAHALAVEIRLNYLKNKK